MFPPLNRNTRSRGRIVTVRASVAEIWRFAASKVLSCYDFRTRSARPDTSDVVLSKIGSESAETGLVKIGRGWAADTDHVVIPSLLSAVGDFEAPYLLEANSVATICASAVNNLTGA